MASRRLSSPPTQEAPVHMFRTLHRGRNASAAMASVVTVAANNAVTAGTWCTYKPVLGHIADCQEFLEQEFEETPTRRDAASLVAYLAAEKGLKSSTISKYLSAWR